jgi:hypothetical protein
MIGGETVEVEQLRDDDRKQNFYKRRRNEENCSYLGRYPRAL